MHLGTTISIITAAAGLGLAGCTIADVTIPASEDRLVVEAVLRTDADRQFVLLHRSVRDGEAPGEPDAEVLVTRGDGVQVRFRQSAADNACYTIDPHYAESEQPVVVRGTCYQSPQSATGWVRPGHTYDLTVRTTRGEVARGRTVVPGAFSLRVNAQRLPGGGELQCTVRPGTPLPLVWTQAQGAWGYIAPLSVSGLRTALPDTFNAPEPLELVGVSVSARDTALVLPGQFGVFQRLDYDQELMRLLQGGLPAGVTALVIVAAADRNYINGVRGGAFNPSGPIRISSIVGDGVGVFGSLVPLTLSIKVGSQDPTAPYCTG